MKSRIAEWLRAIANWLNPPPKAPVFRINNPAQWKLERARRKARELL